jgi:hypothetical protein
VLFLQQAACLEARYWQGETGWSVVSEQESSLRVHGYKPT